MKKFKNKILSVVLLAMTFFVMHDYVIESFSTDMQETQGFYAYDTVTLDTNVDKDIYTQIHDDIHTMFEVDVTNVPTLELVSLTFKPSAYQASLLSYISLAPSKPPII